MYLKSQPTDLPLLIGINCFRQELAKNEPFYCRIRSADCGLEKIIHGDTTDSGFRLPSLKRLSAAQGFGRRGCPQPAGAEDGVIRDSLHKERRGDTGKRTQGDKSLGDKQKRRERRGNAVLRKINYLKLSGSSSRLS